MEAMKKGGTCASEVEGGRTDVIDGEWRAQWRITGKTAREKKTRSYEVTANKRKRKRGARARKRERERGRKRARQTDKEGAPDAVWEAYLIDDITPQTLSLSVKHIKYTHTDTHTHTHTYRHCLPCHLLVPVWSWTDTPLFACFPIFPFLLPLLPSPPSQTPWTPLRVAPSLYQPRKTSQINICYQRDSYTRKMLQLTVRYRRRIVWEFTQTYITKCLNI